MKVKKLTSKNLTEQGDEFHLYVKWEIEGNCDANNQHKHYLTSTDHSEKK